MKSLWKFSAVAVLAVSGVAQADVIPTGTATGSELLLFIRDTTPDANPNRVFATSFGVTVDSILTAAGVSGSYPASGFPNLSFTLPSLSSAAQSAISTFLNGSPGGNFVWTIMAADTQGANAFNQRYVTTTPTDLNTNPVPGNASLTSSWVNVRDLFNSVNGAIPGTDQSGAGTKTLATNAGWGQTGTPNEGAYDWFGGQLLNENVLGDAANFYLLANSAGGADDPARVWNLGTVTLSLAGVISQVLPSTPTVPLPPAIVLLGSAFAGLAGVARRRKLAAAA